ncbi:winged helix-turn-helix domain-containing protein [Nocardiopsis dassonvillei]|uniref:winged helix-turn-helix domain-containing protein n=1 Tax=Nocardiopsis dassonvillei TaxID=2014 RepID=UPI00157BC664|nr:GntR family transcriptional regulator [Nocardiopsis dassonvillei]
MSDRARWGSYQQIAETLRDRFGDAPEGSPVPSEAALGAEFDVSRTTIRRALAVLEDAGVVRVDRGRGRVVGGGPVRTVALHVEIAAKLRARIRQGIYPPGSVLPSESALAASEGASRSTVRAALGVLEGEGLVVAKQGRGRVVV